MRNHNLRAAAGAGGLWSPADLGANLYSWLDANDPATISLSGANVTQWSDKSGNNINAVNATTASQPLYSASSFQSMGGITFDGVNDFLAIATSTPMRNITHGVYWVMKRLSQGTNDAYAPSISTAAQIPQTSDFGTLQYIKSNLTGASYPYYPTGGAFDGVGTFANDTPYIMAFQSNTSGWGVWKNGGITGTTTALGTPTSLAGYVLAKQTSPARYSNIVIAEVIMVSSTGILTRQLIEGYTAWKYGFQASLPSGHPYKLAPPARSAKPVDPYFANVVLLLHADGTNNSTTITDSSSQAQPMTAAGGAVISTAQSKFDGSSLYFPQVPAQRITTPEGNTDFQFGTGDFTVECWVYQTSYTQYASIMEVGSSGGTSGMLFMITGTVMQTYSGGFLGAGFVPLNQWVHLAWSRTSGVLKQFIDGVEVSSYAMTNNLSATSPNTIIGMSTYAVSASYPFAGYIDELRVTKGIGRYTANFTLPSGRF